MGRSELLAKLWFLNLGGEFDPSHKSKRNHCFCDCSVLTHKFDKTRCLLRGISAYRMSKPIRSKTRHAFLQKLMYATTI